MSKHAKLKIISSNTNKSLGPWTNHLIIFMPRVKLTENHSRSNVMKLHASLSRASCDDDAKCSKLELSNVFSINWKQFQVQRSLQLQMIFHFLQCKTIFKSEPRVSRLRKSVYCTFFCNLIADNSPLETCFLLLLWFKRFLELNMQWRKDLFGRAKSGQIK